MDIKVTVVNIIKSLFASKNSASGVNDNDQVLGSNRVSGKINTTNNTNIELECDGAYIARQGELITNPTSYFHALAQEAGEQLKIGAGAVRGIAISNCEDGAIITLSDGLSGITAPLFQFTSGKKFEIPTYIPLENLPFNEGLRLTITANDAGVTVIYE